MTFAFRTATLPLRMLLRIWGNRFLIVQLIRTELSSRYRASFFGVLWTLINPLVMMLIYTLVFGGVFQAKTPMSHRAATGPADFGVFLFTGLIVFSFFSEVISRSPQLILSNVNYVKKVVFPLEVLSVVAVGAALVQAAMNMVVLLAFAVILYGVPSATALLLPLVWLALIPMVLGVSWFLASVGVYLRDTSQVIGFIITFMMFLGPLFYPVSAMPEEFRWLIMLNPLTYPIEASRDVLLYGNPLDPAAFLMFGAISGAVMLLGWVWFHRTRKGFADVL
ncbi:ABC transporter permease [Azospirillum brasilense]|uniref:ABC transporter permease n=1 Tax=Azospirillum brasilense TaxID=192 RepID=UPI000E0BEB71|nr:ABC transporter permease [Azospirillum brasilense]